MRMQFVEVVVVGAFAGALWLCGCVDHSSAGSAPKTVQVAGVVKYHGEPVEGATITFNPPTKPGDVKLRAAFGVTDGQGRFQLTTVSSNDGAIPGDYLVTVSKQTSVGRAPDPTDEEKDYVPPEENESKAAPVAVTLIPAKYALPVTSGLKAEVKDQDRQTLDVELKD